MFFSNTYFSDCMNEKVIQTKENPQVCLVCVLMLLCILW